MRGDRALQSIHYCCVFGKRMPQFWVVNGTHAEISGMPIPQFWVVNGTHAEISCMRVYALK